MPQHVAHTGHINIGTRVLRPYARFLFTMRTRGGEINRTSRMSVKYLVLRCWLRFRYRSRSSTSSSCGISAHKRVNQQSAPQHRRRGEARPKQLHTQLIAVQVLSRLMGCLLVGYIVRVHPDKVQSVHAVVPQFWKAGFGIRAV